jgi:hypothetical protein
MQATNVRTLLFQLLGILIKVKESRLDFDFIFASCCNQKAPPNE